MWRVTLPSNGLGTPGYLGYVERAVYGVSRMPTEIPENESSLDQEVLQLLAKDSEVGGKVCVEGRVDVCDSLMEVCSTVGPGDDLSSFCKMLTPTCKKGNSIELSVDACLGVDMNPCELQHSMCAGSSRLADKPICKALTSLCTPQNK